MATALETPSKHASSALSSLDLSTPPAPLAAKLDAVKTVAAAAKPSRDELAKRFVGDLDCEESDEPILQETCVLSSTHPLSQLGTEGGVEGRFWPRRVASSHEHNDAPPLRPSRPQLRPSSLPSNPPG